MANQVELDTDSQVWKQDYTWGIRGKSADLDPQDFPSREALVHRITEITESDIQEDIFYPTIFLESLYEFTNSSALYAYYDPSESINMYVEYVSTRTGMTMEALRELPQDDYETKAIHLLRLVQYNLNLYLEWCRQEGVRPEKSATGRRLKELQTLICKEEIDLLQGTEQNKDTLFGMLLEADDETGFPILRERIIAELQPGRQSREYLPWLRLLDAHPRLLHKDLFRSLMMIWKTKVLRGIDRVKTHSYTIKRDLGASVFDKLAYLGSAYSPEELGVASNWRESFRENLISLGIARKLEMGI